MIPESTHYIIHKLYKNDETSYMCLTCGYLGTWQAVIHQAHAWKEGSVGSRSVHGLRQKSHTTDSSERYHFTYILYFLIMFQHIFKKTWSWEISSSWFANDSPLIHLCSYLLSFNKCWLSAYTKTLNLFLNTSHFV